MPNLSDFKGIPPITWGFLVVFIIGTIIPGLLLIFLFREDLFLSVETVKLLFLSMGITLPVWGCNTVLFALAIGDDDKGNSDDSVKAYLQLIGIIGAVLSIPSLCVPALIKMFVDISSDIAFYIGFGIEIIIISLLVLSIWGENKRK